MNARTNDDKPYEGPPDPDIPSSVDGKQDNIEIEDDES